MSATHDIYTSLKLDKEVPRAPLTLLVNLTTSFQANFHTASNHGKNEYAELSHPEFYGTTKLQSNHTSRRARPGKVIADRGARPRRRSPGRRGLCELAAGFPSDKAPLVASAAPQYLATATAPQSKPPAGMATGACLCGA